jgi:hypothetical protein
MENIVTPIIECLNERDLNKGEEEKKIFDLI